MMHGRHEMLNEARSEMMHGWHEMLNEAGSEMMQGWEYRCCSVFVETVVEVDWLLHPGIGPSWRRQL